MLAATVSWAKMAFCQRQTHLVYDENNILPGTYENKFDPAYTPQH